MTYLDEIARRIARLVPAELVPQDSRDLFRLYALLARSKGPAVTAEDVHDAWVAWMEARGEAHPSMVPFEELSPAIKREDEPFVEAIRRVSSEM
jgi:hypothetical protein